MKEGDVILAALQQAVGPAKPRPGVVLRQMRPYGDLLVCGISTQLKQEVAGFDEIIGPADADFSASGLRTASLIRLGHLGIVARGSAFGVLGAIDAARHKRLLKRLSDYLIA